MTVRQTGRRRGFTLIEILVVVIIIATLAAAVVLSLSGKPDEARAARAKADIGTLETAIEAFRLDMRRYPTDEEGLGALVRKPDGEDADRWKGPYLKRLEKDPWDRDYVYAYPGDRNENGYDLYSLGADGRPGGQDVNADIVNWSEED
ncbi:MAG: type II secretion system major pseudopilin GspG [Candidatus Sumerlaeia bacterium]|nr:type II secretion system major pseudopilin GspG [Candidatus Sumerlaeia bacterium]